MSSEECISDSEERHKARYGVTPKFFVVEGSGVLVRQDITVAETQLLQGLFEVVQRIDDAGTCNALLDCG